MASFDSRLLTSTRWVRPLSLATTSVRFTHVLGVTSPNWSIGVLAYCWSTTRGAGSPEAGLVGEVVGARGGFFDLAKSGFFAWKRLLKSIRPSSASPGRTSMPV